MADTTTKPLTAGPDPDPDESPEPRRFLGLSLTQIAGSALAAVTAAVAASFLGVAGTLIGAALGSVVSTVAGAAYATSLQTAAGRLRTRTVVVRADGARTVVERDVPASPARSAGDAGRRVRWSRVPWKAVAAVAAVGFVLGLGLLTLTEGVLGRPVSGSTSGRTTVGELVGGGSGTPATPSPAATTPSATPSATATTPDATATATPSADATGTATGTAADGAPTDGGTSTAETSPTPSASVPEPTTQPTDVTVAPPSATP